MAEIFACFECKTFLNENDDFNFVQVYSDNKCTGMYMCLKCENDLKFVYDLVFDDNFEQYMSKKDYIYRHEARCYHCNDRVSGIKSVEIFTNFDEKEQIHLECLNKCENLCNCKKSLKVKCECNKFTGWCYNMDHNVDDSINVYKSCDSLMDMCTVTSEDSSASYNRYLCMDCI